ncbi:MAG TPA: pentapeptide repeat-containing protein [Azospirillaceae bacterium]|nr:pentapeptide repeat-containing protein [Azospirillaceae bacterium]
MHDTPDNPVEVVPAETGGRGQTLSRQALDAVLVAHRDWLATEGIHGRQADLRGTDLRGCSFWRADLRHALLNGCDLRSTNLDHADLTQASLVGARLNGASLWESRLQQAVLAQADLHGANLDHADLSDTDLTQVDLTGASLWGARLHGADLRLVIGVTPAQLATASSDGRTRLPPPGTAEAPR